MCIVCDRISDISTYVYLPKNKYVHYERVRMYSYKIHVSVLVEVQFILLLVLLLYVHISAYLLYIKHIIAKSRLLEAAAETPEATAGGWRHAQLPGFNRLFHSTGSFE